MANTLKDETKALLWRLALADPEATKALIRETETILPITSVEAREIILSLTSGPHSTQSTQKIKNILTKMGEAHACGICIPSFSNLIGQLSIGDSLKWLDQLFDLNVWPMQCREEHFFKVLDRLKAGDPYPVLLKFLSHWASHDASTFDYHCRRHEDIYHELIHAMRSSKEDVAIMAWRAASAMAQSGMAPPTIDLNKTEEEGVLSFWQTAALIPCSTAQISMVKRDSLLILAKTNWCDKGVAKLHKNRRFEITDPLLSFALQVENEANSGSLNFDEACQAFACEIFTKTSPILAEDKVGRSALAVFNSILNNYEMSQTTFDNIEKLMIAVIKNGANPTSLSPMASKIAATPALASLAKNGERNKSS